MVHAWVVVVIAAGLSTGLCACAWAYHVRQRRVVVPSADAGCSPVPQHTEMALPMQPLTVQPLAVQPLAVQPLAVQPPARPMKRYITPDWLRPPSMNRMMRIPTASRYVPKPRQEVMLGFDGGGGVRIAPPQLNPIEPGQPLAAIRIVSQGALNFAQSVLERGVSWRSRTRIT